MKTLQATATIDANGKLTVDIPVNMPPGEYQIVLVLEEKPLSQITQEQLIKKTLGVCGENARIRDTRIPIWTLVSFKKQGASQEELLRNYPSLTVEDLAAAWLYYEQNPEEIDRIIAEDN
jgi:uncharacterized protein (DUF433 family)